MQEGGLAADDAMGQRKRLAMRALLLSGFGAALAACTTTETEAPYYPYYGPYYGRYYGYPSGYYYPAPAYGSLDFFYGHPWWWERPFPHRRFISPPPAPAQAAPPSPAPRGGSGFLGNVTRQQPQASPPASGGAQGGSSGGRRGFLGNVLRQHQ